MVQRIWPVWCVTVLAACCLVNLGAATAAPAVPDERVPWQLLSWIGNVISGCVAAYVSVKVSVARHDVRIKNLEGWADYLQKRCDDRHPVRGPR